MTQQAISLDNILAAMNSLVMSPDGVTPQNEQDWLNLSLSFLGTPQFGGFPITSWEDGEPAKALIQNNAHTMNALSPTVYNAICGGILDLAAGPWLDLWGNSVYHAPRNSGVQQVQALWLQAVTAAVNLNPGDLIVATDDGLAQYTPVVQDPDNPGSYIQQGISIPVAGADGTLTPSGGGYHLRCNVGHLLYTCAGLGGLSWHRWPAANDHQCHCAAHELAFYGDEPDPRRRGSDCASYRRRPRAGPALQASPAVNVAGAVRARQWDDWGLAGNGPEHSQECAE